MSHAALAGSRCAACTPLRRDARRARRRSARRPRPPSTRATTHATASRTTSACSLPISLSTTSRSGHPPAPRPSWCFSFVGSLAGTDDSEARGGRPSSGPARARPLHHFYRLDRNWPPLRLARVRCERESVGVVLPAALPSCRRRAGRWWWADRSGWTCIATSVRSRSPTAARARSAGRIATTPEQLELFAQSLAPTDRVVMEATGNALAIARILEPHVAEVVLAHAKQVRAISHARVEDRQDRRASAGRPARRRADPGGVDRRRARADAAPAGVAPPRAGQARARRSRTRSARCCMRNLKGRSPASDLFGARAAPGSAEQRAADRRAPDRRRRACASWTSSATSSPRSTRSSPQHALGDEDVRRLMTIPGIDVVTAATLVAVDRRHPPLPDLAPPGRLPRAAPDDPPVRQRPGTPRPHVQGGLGRRPPRARRGRLVGRQEPGPAARVRAAHRARRGRHVATVAVARKLAVLAWHLLTRGEDYAFQRPSLVRRKIRAPRAARRRAARQARPEPRPGLEHQPPTPPRSASPTKPRPPTAASSPTGRPRGPKAGAGATPERASQRPSKGKAARQATSS